MSHPRPVRHSLLAALMLLVASLPLSALAGAGRVVTVVTPLSGAVTYSTPASAGIPGLTNVAGYEVLVSNAGRNTINHIRFTGGTGTTAAGQSAVFDSAEGATCSATDDTGTTISCDIGQLKARTSAPVFRVFFRSPVRAPGNTLPNGSVAGGQCSGDCLTFQGVTDYAEGTHGPYSRPVNSSAPWSAAPVALGTPSTSRLSTAVLKPGAQLYTGKGGVTVSGDSFATTVVVPAVPSSTTAEIVETPFSLAEGCVNFKTCWQSDITIPVPTGTTSFSPYLRIVLRVDAANIRPGKKITEVVPLYEGVPIGMCASPTTPRNDGVPCIAETKVYRKTSKYTTPGWTPALNCDFEWTILNVVNGSYRMP